MSSVHSSRCKACAEACLHPGWWEQAGKLALLLCSWLLLMHHIAGSSQRSA